MKKAHININMLCSSAKITLLFWNHLSVYNALRWMSVHHCTNPCMTRLHNHFPPNGVFLSEPNFLHASKVTNTHCINTLVCILTCFSHLFFILICFLFYCFLLTRLTFKELDPNQPLKQQEDQKRVGTAIDFAEGAVLLMVDWLSQGEGGCSHLYCSHSMAPPTPPSL